MSSTLIIQLSMLWNESNMQAHRLDWCVPTWSARYHDTVQVTGSLAEHTLQN
jgi:hypothetical protein